MTTLEKERSQLVAKSINEAKALLGDSFTSQELINALKKTKCMYLNYIPTMLIKRGYISRLPKRKLQFTLPKQPIAAITLVNALSQIAQTCANYSKKSLEKKKDRKNNNFKSSTSSFEIVLIDNEEEKAIKLLKSMGYKIFKPIIQYQEI